MCLTSNYRGNKQHYIKDLETRVDGYIWLWKLFALDEEDNLIAQFQKYDFYEGKNTAKGKVIKSFHGYRSDCQYEPGFHCFASEEQAINWDSNSRNDENEERVVVPIKVRRTWITTIGYQDSAGKVIVCKHIII